MDIETFSAPPHTFDLIISRLALHYIDDLDAVLAACWRGLSPGGRLLITVVHPVITSHEARQSTEQARTNWVGRRLLPPRSTPAQLAGQHRHLVSPGHRGLRHRPDTRAVRLCGAKTRPWRLTGPSILSTRVPTPAVSADGPVVRLVDASLAGRHLQ
ncbi:methyltransferase domain-containing protein, partial [Nonomuraea sp. NPDC049607]|uniref:class I SAM-dependent methyltransferase n=1 Tax=Nonomuraea sp. NPDC049607 TaxID=3154732 RepID=UPI00341A61E7